MRGSMARLLIKYTTMYQQTVGISILDVANFSTFVCQQKITIGTVIATEYFTHPAPSFMRLSL